MLDKSRRGLDEYSRGRSRRRRSTHQGTLPRRDIWSENRLTLREPRRSRNRRHGLSWWLWVPVSLALGLSIPYAFKWGHQNGIFAGKAPSPLKRLLIETDGNLTEAAIADASGIRIGENLHRLDLEEIEDRLVANPRIREVEIEQRSPDSLLIRVRERVPLAWLSCPDHEIRPLRDGGMLLDSEGVVFQIGPMNETLAVLPTIEVTGITRPVDGARVQSLPVQQSLRLIQANDILFAGQGMNIIDLRTLSDWGLLCRYPNELEVIFHLQRIEGGLRDLEEILKKTRELEVPLATVNLVAVKNIPVTFHSEISPEKWQNSSATALEKRVRSNKQIQEKHLRSIWGDG